MKHAAAFAIIFCSLLQAHASRSPLELSAPKPRLGLPKETGLNATRVVLAEDTDTALVFDIPISYNQHVQRWISYFQGPGRKWFRTWLERSHEVLPRMQSTFQSEGLPRDLTYMAMIESGFSPNAVSIAFAVGPWQFIKPTAERFGLKINWWLDERRDFDKSTKAAARYIRSIYDMFGSWYLVAAAYNTGENRVKRLIAKHRTKNFWELVKRGAFVEETENYIPKLLAATLIAKAPSLYGFRDLNWVKLPNYDFFQIPGGTKLEDVANLLDVTPQHLRQLNPELLMGYVPPMVSGHRIRIPKGASPKLSEHIRRGKLAQSDLPR